MVTSKKIFFCIPQGKPWSNSLIQKVFLTVKVRPSFDGLLNYIERYLQVTKAEEEGQKVRSILQLLPCKFLQECELQFVKAV